MSKKVDLKALRKAKEIWEGRPSAFCDVCGVIKPQCGFYPLFSYSSETSLSGLTCNDCKRKEQEDEANRI